MSASASWLFVPGDRPERFDKAVASGADEVIIDLEDAVEVSRKEEARAATAAWLTRGSAWVRINAADTAEHELDLSAMRGAAGLRGVMVPKAESGPALSVLGAGGVRIVALIETAVGLHHLDEIAACPVVVRLAFGSIDLALDLDCAETDEALLYARSRLVLASRIAHRAAPIDGVTTDLSDEQATVRAAQHARGLGFGGKLCVHPAQVAGVGQVFRPSDDEIAWASRVLEMARSGGAVGVDGRMVDRPVVERASRILMRVQP